ncbi:hypothetical protein BST81_17290 [Leptolyngbya sp. 'hensonii']|uniref:hypothetical protein n=1 Tax=Leptolyngbya sp. 'hensonii' TaxID=1922337 RepID=UPI0009503376|nr:hypothetical protein [Leptolyngbya sp. 'hensonii']OLP17110.1 hypothetical protein BST81_17290 [Leptolyngbya sp. 'hensonii']
MFAEELSPLLKEFAKEPIAFMGGLVTGFLRLNLAEDPVKSWLDRQARGGSHAAGMGRHDGNGSGPQSITIE